MLPQNKISGLNIAWGRGKWTELDDGSSGYTFPEDDAYQIRISPEAMEDLDIDEDDLYDCIAQIEAEYGKPKDYRLAFGLNPNQGYSHLGITVRSRYNDRVVCVFTPTSIEDKSYDGYFEWYYDQYAGGFNNLADYLTRFDKATDGQHSNMILSPVMPSYGEASEKTQLVMNEAEREQFLRQVWAYYKTPSRGFKQRLESELLPRWKKICEEYEDMASQEQYKNDLKDLTLNQLKQVASDLASMIKAYKDNRPDGPDYNLDRKSLEDQLRLVKDEMYKRSVATQLDLPAK